MSAIVYQLDSRGHRGTSAIKRLVEYAPSTGGLALWMQHRDVDVLPALAHTAGGRASPIANDGLTLFYTPEFDTHSLRERTGLVAHQVLHVAFRHVARRDALRRSLGEIDEHLWNAVADALINASLVKHDWLSLPDGAVELQRLLIASLGIDTSLEASLQRWDAESLYRAIDDGERRGSPGRARRQRSQDGGGGAPQDTAAHGEEQASAEAADERRDGPRAAAARAATSALLPDLLPGQEHAVEQDAAHTRDWHQRLLRAHAADGGQSLLRVLGADHRLPRTPWHLSLRTRLARDLAPVPELSWSRPTRSWLASRGRTASGHRLPIEPGTVTARSVPRLVIVADVSGSVDDRLVDRFGREIARVQRVHRAGVWLVAGDDRVRREQRLSPERLRAFRLDVQGGEGTDFRPLLSAACAYRPDLIIVLSDLDGPAGAPPPVPVIWATPAQARAPTPFGSRLYLE